jgi:hypothetical protein
VTISLYGLRSFSQQRNTSDHRRVTESVDSRRHHWNRGDLQTTRPTPRLTGVAHTLVIPDVVPRMGDDDNSSNDRSR